MGWGWGWAYDGVNASIPRNTGPECSEYLSVHRRLIESAFVVPILTWILKWAIDNARPIVIKYPKYNGITPGRQILLVGMTFTLGLELGFKLASRTVIYILNPCHITSIFQIYLLAARPSKTSTVLFRIQLNLLNGPLLAYLFPEIESRTIPLEAVTYYVQHGLMFIIPIYLLRQGGAFNAEPLGEFYWSMISYMLLLIYHFTVLQIFSIPFQVNLNHMLCPAILDPFEGQNYRLFACIHQAILCPSLCKLFTFLFRPSTMVVAEEYTIEQNAHQMSNKTNKIILTETINKIQLEQTLSSDNTGCDDNQSKTTQLIENIVKKVE